MQIVFDKLAYLDRLKAAGVAEPQARAHAEALEVALREEVATKSDIDSLRVDLDALRADLKAEADALRAELRIVARDLKIWMGGVTAGAVTLLAAFRFFV